MIRARFHRSSRLCELVVLCARSPFNEIGESGCSDVPAVCVGSASKTSGVISSSVGSSGVVSTLGLRLGFSLVFFSLHGVLAFRCLPSCFSKIGSRSEHTSRAMGRSTTPSVRRSLSLFVCFLNESPSKVFPWTRGRTSFIRSAAGESTGIFGAPRWVMPVGRTPLRYMLFSELGPDVFEFGMPFTSISLTTSGFLRSNGT